MATKQSSTAEKLAKFRKPLTEGQTIRLPVSDMEVTLRPIALQGLVRRGLIPSELFATAMAGFPEMEALSQSVRPDDLNRLTEMTLSVDEWYSTVLREMLIEPAFGDVPGPEVLALEDFAAYPEDLQFLMGLAQIPIKNWETFRERQVSSLQRVADGEVAEGQAE